jgi:hypothetical protein
MKIVRNKSECATYLSPAGGASSKSVLLTCDTVPRTGASRRNLDVFNVLGRKRNDVPQLTVIGLAMTQTNGVANGHPTERPLSAYKGVLGDKLEVLPVLRYSIIFGTIMMRYGNGAVR